MAVIKRIASKASPKKLVNYLKDKEKTEERLISGKDCSPQNVVNEFNSTQELYNKNNGVRYHHIIQSFSPEDDITPEKAHELGRELAESQFKGHEVFIVTHKDKDHIHNHLVVNSVNFENGKKYKSSNKSLWDIKRESNRQCERENLKTIDLDKKSCERLTSGELRMTLRGQLPWKEDLKQCISFAKEKTNNFNEFSQYLKNNFEIETRVTNKTISYKHPQKEKSIRGSKLGASYDKEVLENEFARKEKTIDRATSHPTERSGAERNTPNVDWSAIRNNIKGERDRVSEQSSDDVTRTIQQKVREVKDRTDRATGQSKQENRTSPAVKQDINGEHKQHTREPKKAIKTRGFGIER